MILHSFLLLAQLGFVALALKIKCPQLLVIGGVFAAMEIAIIITRLTP